MAQEFTIFCATAQDFELIGDDRHSGGANKNATGYTQDQQSRFRLQHHLQALCATKPPTFLMQEYRHRPVVHDLPSFRPKARPRNSSAEYGGCDRDLNLACFASLGLPRRGHSPNLSTYLRRKYQSVDLPNGPPGSPLSRGGSDSAYQINLPERVHNSKKLPNLAFVADSRFQSTTTRLQAPG